MNQIKVYDSVSLMSGVGEEWLVVNGNVTAVFMNGNIACSVHYIGNSEVTKVA